MLLLLFSLTFLRRCWWMQAAQRGSNNTHVGKEQAHPAWETQQPHNVPLTHPYQSGQLIIQAQALAFKVSSALFLRDWPLAARSFDMSKWPLRQRKLNMTGDRGWGPRQFISNRSNNEQYNSALCLCLSLMVGPWPGEVNHRQQICNSPFSLCFWKPKRSRGLVMQTLY